MSGKPDILHLTFQNDISLGLEFIAIDDQYIQTHKNLHVPHRASFYLIFWFKEGTPVHIVDFNPVCVIPDSFLFIHKEAVQFFDQKNAFESSTLLFTDTFFCEDESDHHFLQSSVLFHNFTSGHGSELIAATTQMQELWLWMQTEVQNPADRFQSAVLRKLLYGFLLLAEREQLKLGKNTRLQGQDFESLLNFNSLLEKHFRKEKGIVFYAEKLSVSAKVLTNATQHMLGKTPKQLIDERVLLEAKRLLVHSNNPVKTIGFFLGFDEPTNFNKFFKKHSGQTPAAFRVDFSKS